MLEQTIITAVRAALPQLVIYHDFAPPEAKPPLMILARVGGSGSLYVEDGLDHHIRVQISIWAQQRLEAIALSRAVAQALFRLPEIAADGAAVAVHDVDTDWRGMRQDFFVLETA